MSVAIVLYTAVFALCSVSVGSSSQYDMWQSRLRVSERIPTAVNASGGELLPPVAEEEARWMYPRIMVLRDALRSQTLHLNVKIEAGPAEIAKLEQNRFERNQKYRMIVEDCSDVDLSTVAVPEESVIHALRHPTLRYEYLGTLPKAIACWFVDNDNKKLTHKIMIKEVTTARMIQLTRRCAEVAAEIDELRTAEEIRSFYLDTFGIFASNRGKWLRAVKQLVVGRMRFENIKTEFASFVENAPPSIAGSVRRCPAAVWNNISAALLNIASAFVSEDDLYSDILRFRSVLERVSPVIPKPYDRSQMIKQAKP